MNDTRNSINRNQVVGRRPRQDFVTCGWVMGWEQVMWYENKSHGMITAYTYIQKWNIGLNSRASFQTVPLGKVYSYVGPTANSLVISMHTEQHISVSLRQSISYLDSCSSYLIFHLLALSREPFSTSWIYKLWKMSSNDHGLLLPALDLRLSVLKSCTSACWRNSHAKSSLYTCSNFVSL